MTDENKPQSSRGEGIGIFVPNGKTLHASLSVGQRSEFLL